METMKSLNYLRAKKKVEVLKQFYGHLAVFLVINTAIILVSAKVFGQGDVRFAHWEIYITTFFWGIGLVSHAVYVIFKLYFRNNFLSRWEERKIKQFLEQEKF